MTTEAVQVNDKMVEARKAVEELANLPLGIPLSDWCRLSSTILAALAHREAEAVAVKPLEWFSPSNGRDTLERVETCLGVHRVWTHHEAEGLWFWSLDGYEKASGEADSIHAAKAAAQADYERRIRSALVATPPASKVMMSEFGPVHFAPAAPPAVPADETVVEADAKAKLRVAFRKALNDLPEIAPPEIASVLASVHMRKEFINEGKRLQLEHGTDAVAPRVEQECGAGAWSFMRSGVLSALASKPAVKGDETMAALREVFVRWADGYGFNEDSEEDVSLRDRAALAATEGRKNG